MQVESIRIDIKKEQIASELYILKYLINILEIITPTLPKASANICK